MVAQDQAKLMCYQHQQPNIDKIYWCFKNLFKSKNQLFTNRREKVQMKKSKNPKAFISYLQTIDNAYKNLEVYNPTSVNSVWKAKNIAFVSQSYFKVPKTIWLNLIHCFIMKMPKRTEL